MNILDNFRLAKEKEDFQKVNEVIENGVAFKGTNLWILIFAIFIASLGLNVNSTAVIIGAMLISPLMGPIMGIGFGMAVNDLALLRKSFLSYAFAAAVGLAASTIFFFISPLNEAHSEILARTAPNIYDVLIALFGGLAGMLATSSKLKGNVIPGVAIATALMPPLCTAGYGLALLKPEFFFGAFYLFLINSVFIALATVITARFLKYPFKHLPKKEDEKKAKRIMWLVVLITFLPSLYFGYDMVQRNKFIQRASYFIENEATFPNDYLLKKDIDAKNKAITLTYGGDFIEETEIEKLKARLTKYDLDNIKLKIQQGFTYLQQDNKQSNQLSLAITDKERQIQALKNKLDSMSSKNELTNQVYEELKAQYPPVVSLILQQALQNTGSEQKNVWICFIGSKEKINEKEKAKIKDWLKIRIKSSDLIINFEVK
ncbi:MAG: TIGR00341 family protein [Bacteroidota bacterium]